MNSLAGEQSTTAQSAAGLRWELLSGIPCDVVPARRIGVIADSHCHNEDGSDLPGSVMSAFEGVDLILHCGDLNTTGVLDRLARLAPVIAVRSVDDPHEEGRRLLTGPRLVVAGGVPIGIAAHLEATSQADLDQVFGTEVVAAVCGTTHAPRIDPVGDATIVNPGSPTLPASGLPTVALLEVHAEDDRFQIESRIIELAASPEEE